MTNLVVTETFLLRQKKRLTEENIDQLDWNMFCGIYSAASGEVVAEDYLSEALKSLEEPKIFPDGTIGRKITTSHLREFLTTFGDDRLSDSDVQELIQVCYLFIVESVELTPVFRKWISYYKVRCKQMRWRWG